MPASSRARAVGSIPPGRALEQVVLECQPQPRQGVARGGLGDAQPCGGAGDVALGIDRLEHPQQVEVEPLQSHAAIIYQGNIGHAISEFPK